jgi:hypothetical protein
MTPTEHHDSLVRVLATLDQDAQESYSIAAARAMPLPMRRRARVYLEYFRRTAARAEQLLAALNTVESAECRPEKTSAGQEFLTPPARGN